MPSNPLNGDEQKMRSNTPNASIAMIVVLSSIAMLSGFLVVLVSQLTAPMIAENQRIAIEKALLEVIPGSVSNKVFLLQNGKLTPSQDLTNKDNIYVGYDANGKLSGIASRAAAQGYADMIYLLYGYDPNCECIRGFKVLKMSETPGLGDKIIKDVDFQANFEALDARIEISKMRLVNPIVTVKHGTKQQPWEIDAITGATISSKAVGNALNQSAQVLLPKLQPLIPQLQGDLQ